MVGEGGWGRAPWEFHVQWNSKTNLIPKEGWGRAPGGFILNELTHTHTVPYTHKHTHTYTHITLNELICLLHKGAMRNALICLLHYGSDQRSMHRVAYVI